MAIEKISFKIFRHAVDLGTTYMNNVAWKTFVHYIAEANCQELADTLAKADFLSNHSWIDLQIRIVVTMS